MLKNEEPSACRGQVSLEEAAQQQSHPYRYPLHEVLDLRTCTECNAVVKLPPEKYEKSSEKGTDFNQYDNIIIADIEHQLDPLENLILKRQ